MNPETRKALQKRAKLRDDDLVEAVNTAMKCMKHHRAMDVMTKMNILGPIRTRDDMAPTARGEVEVVGQPQHRE